MKLKNRISINNSLLIVITVLGMLFFTYSIHQYLHLGEKSMESILKTTEGAIVKELDALEEKLNVDFRKAESTANKMAAKLNENLAALKNLIPSIINEVHKNNFSALGLHFSEEYSKEVLNRGYRKFVKRKKNGNMLYSPFFKNGMTEVIPFPYDYTDPLSNGRLWYSEALTIGSWTKPYFGPANRNFVLSYRAPFKVDFKQGQNKGIICVDYSLNSIGKTVGELNLLKSGYGIVLNQDNIVISHPVEEFLGRPISELMNELAFSILDTIQEKRFHDLSSYKNKLLNGKLIYKRTIDVTPADFKGNNASFKYRVLIILNKKETLTEFVKGGHQTFYRSENSLRIRLILLGVLCILSLTQIFYQFGNKRNGWVVVGIYSIVCVLATCLIWFCHLKFSVNSSFREEIEVTNKTDLEAIINYFENKQKDEQDTLWAAPIKIKTGFFIQSVKFSSATDIQMTGYVWQKHPPKLSEQLQKAGIENIEALSFVFPEAQDFSSEIVFSNKELTRWYFTATLRQSFDYSQYPFDDEEIWIRIQPSSFYQNKILLIPDFESYPSFDLKKQEGSTQELLSDNEVSGLENDIFIEGWDIRRTYFSFRKNPYSSNFGTKETPQLRVQPELYFNISIRRNFTGVFVGYMIPILVTAFLLFTVLMINTRNKDKNELFGFNAATVLSFCASLFFVLTVSHMSLRDTLSTKGVIYLEYFFFCLYIALAVISVYSIIFAQSNSTSKIHREDGLLIKMCFWPVLLISILIITSICFNY